MDVLRNVPMPRKTRTSRREPKYPWATMGVGDSFFVPDKEPTQMHATVSRHGKALGRRFKVRRAIMRDSLTGWVPCPPEAVGATPGVGVWRAE